MSRLNIVAALLFVGGLLWVFTMDTEKRQALQGKVLGWFAPLNEAEQRIIDNNEVMEASSMNPAELVASNRDLEAQLAEARVRGGDNEELRRENGELRAQLSYLARSFHKLIPARVINRPGSNWWSALVINKGTSDGVATDAPVRSELGLVGKTAQIEKHSTKVLLLTDEQCWVAAKMEGFSHPGMVRGQRSSGTGSTLLRMQFLDKDVPIPAGTRVYTRGVDGVYPPNILIGEVLEFIPGDIDAEAIVQPAVDFSSVRNLFVIVMENRRKTIPVDAQGNPILAEPAKEASP